MAALIWHLVIKISAGDDVVYFQTLMDGRSIWEILAHRYATWSSRMAIEFVLIPLVQVPWLWKILDIIVFTLIPVLLYRLLFLNPEKYLDMECNINKTAGKWLVCAFMLLYPFSDMVSAGWIATTVNYLWPLLGLLYIALLLQKLAQKDMYTGMKVQAVWFPAFFAAVRSRLLQFCWCCCFLPWFIAGAERSLEVCGSTDMQSLM